MNSDNFRQFLLKYPENKLVFVGLGNPIRKDDYAGLVFLEILRKSEWFKQSLFISAGTNPENHLQKILNFKPQAVIFIDTARFHNKPGSIQFLDRETLDEIRVSTHAFSMTLIEDFLKSEQDMEFHYLGIEPEDISIGEGLSPKVAQNLNLFFNSTALL